MNSPYKLLPTDSFLPRVPNYINSYNPLWLEQEKSLEPHYIFYIKYKNILLYSYPYLPFKPYLTVSSRHKNEFKDYTSFLFFTQLKKDSYRYGIFFNPQDLSLLEVKLTLYSFPHHPISINIIQNTITVVNKHCFIHSHFSFFLLWKDCEKFPVTINLKFFNGETYSSTFIFKNIIEPL